MDKQEYGGIEYYLDDIQNELIHKFKMDDIRGPNGLTGNFPEEAALMPFLWAAYNTNRAYGFTSQGYDDVAEIFRKQNSGTIGYALAFKNTRGFKTLIDKDYLRVENYEGKEVFFPTEKLFKIATK
ncbi:hypothetical protein EOM09_04025 [bacterium]|nr:hypothetical protein [bacterium]